MSDETDHFQDDAETGPASLTYINESGLPDDVVFTDRFNTEIASQVEKWSQSLNPTGPTGSIDMFARNKWQNARHPFAIMSQTAWAVENDDILSTLADVIEGLAFKKMRFELNDADQQDVWNQWARDVDLDTRLREQFRDLFKVSMVYVGLDWNDRVYSVRDTPINETIEAMERVKAAKQAAQVDAVNSVVPPGGVVPLGHMPDAPPAPEPVATPPGPGRGNRKRKKKFALTVPTAMTIFDPTKILPVGQFMFGKERFAYIASPSESQAFGLALDGTVMDSTVLALVERKYDPTQQDLKLCAEVGIDGRNLWLLKAGAIYRHSLTRAQYEPFPANRLKPVLEILEMKHHLRSSDRASLIGNTNFIVVVTKGTDKLPARPPEIENLREQVRVIARLPVLVGDHRLEVKIVAPPIDNTLTESRWQVLDSRLVFTALRTFQPIVQGGQGTGAVTEMAHVVGQGLESRRHQLVRALEREVFAEIMKRNDGVLSEDPNLAFAPKRVTLDFSVDIMNSILKLRDRGDVSRETTLDEFDYDQDIEVVRRAREKAFYDDVFASQTPFGSPATNPYAALTPGNPSPLQGAPPAPAAAPAAAKPAAAPAAKPAAKPAVKAAAKGTTPAGGRPAGTKDTKPRVAAGTVKA